ncbi:MAG: non-homologous end-joining DNA ligase [Candidatus Promineifilaceae bacterium]
MNNRTVKVGSQTIEVERADKLLFPEDGISKGDLVDYYLKMAETILPHMKGRPVTMQRFPNGIAEEGFYQKEAPDYFPDWIQRVSIRVEGSGEEQDQIICDDAATLAYLANQACITPHIWLSRADKLDYPDKLIFDLDPPNHNFQIVREAAFDLRAALEEVELASYVMTTGSRGLHVVIPLDRNSEFDEVREFARKMGDKLAARYPDRLTIAQRKADRGQRLFLDYTRNAYGQNSITPYAPRPLPGAPVATPLEWSELANADLDSQSYRMDNIFRRLAQKEDPWKDMRRHAQSLDKARQYLQQL